MSLFIKTKVAGNKVWSAFSGAGGGSIPFWPFLFIASYIAVLYIVFYQVLYVLTILPILLHKRRRANLPMLHHLHLPNGSVTAATTSLWMLVPTVVSMGDSSWSPTCTQNRDISVAYFGRDYGKNRDNQDLCALEFEANFIHWPRLQETSAAYAKMGRRYHVIEDAIF